MKKIYQLHRQLSIIIAIPVLLWAVSGFMHPLMTNIRPKVATQFVPPVPMDSARIRVSLAEALRKHHIDSIAGFRLVHIDTNWFYQVRPVSGAPVYLSCTNGNVLAAGDWLYAQYLARYFLEGGDGRGAQAGRSPQARPQGHGAHEMVMQGATAIAGAGMTAHEGSSAMHDCCGAATETVLNPVKGARVANVSEVKTFNKEYKSINRLLPVYRVDFQREDGIRVYVETTMDRFGFAMDNRRALFDEVFRYFHLWGWLDWMGKGRLAVVMLVASTALLTAVLGIWIFFKTRTTKVAARRNHRWTAIVASLFTLFWTFSGAYHAGAKFRDDTRDRYDMHPHFAADSMGWDLGRLMAACPAPVANIGIVRVNGADYFRVVMMPDVAYVRCSDYSLLPDGDAHYASYLAGYFSGRPGSNIVDVKRVTAFGDEYNFTDKRLPVWKVNYGSERWYIETATGKLASWVDSKAVAEGWSFSVFHKHHFMDWGGKATRDVSTMVWAFMQIVLVVVGLILWFKKRSGKNSRTRASA